MTEGQIQIALLVIIVLMMALTLAEVARAVRMIANSEIGRAAALG